MSLTVAHYIEFLSATAEALPTPQRYQGYFPGETRTFDGKTYQFSPFSIAGDVSTAGTEAGDYELIAPANLLSAAKLWEASEERYFIKILTVLLACTPSADVNSIPVYNELNFLSFTLCVCDTFAYSDKIPGESEENSFAPVTLRLSSPLDFVAGTAPTRRLTADQVGPLPSSGGILF